jgi:hypothetical protein
MIDTTYFSARESWLQEAVSHLRPKFVEIGFELPETVRVAVGFGPTGARQESNVILGVCLSRGCAADGVNEIWISPEEASTARMLATLIHELVHAALDNEDGHKGRFAEAATRLGLEGKMTATVPGPDLLMELELIVAALGEYPGALVDLAGVLVGPDGKRVPSSSGPKKQGTRMIKLVCANDCACGGYTVRTTAKWIEVGLPSCPMGLRMMIEIPKGED